MQDVTDVVCDDFSNTWRGQGTKLEVRRVPGHHFASLKHARHSIEQSWPDQRPPSPNQLPWPRYPRFSDSGSQDGTDSWDPLGGEGAAAGRAAGCTRAAESGRGHPRRPGRARVSSTDTGDKLAIDRNSLQDSQAPPRATEALLRNMYRKYMDH